MQVVQIKHIYMADDLHFENHDHTPLPGCKVSDTAEGLTFKTTMTCYM